MGVQYLIRRGAAFLGSSHADWRIGDQRCNDASDLHRLASACGWRLEIVVADGIADLLRWSRSDDSTTQVAFGNALGA